MDKDEAKKIIEVVSSEGGESGSAKSDAEELREVLGAVSEFISGLTKPLEEIIETLLKTVDGAKIGAEVAEFYRKLREAGMPEDLAADMTKEFFEKRTKVLDVVSSLGEFIKKEISE